LHPDYIVECHGSIHHVQIGNSILPADDIHVDIDENTFRTKNPPKNDRGDIIRPNILMFGDFDWISTRTEDQQDRMNNWLARIFASPSKLVVVEIGAGSAIPTVRRTAEKLAQRHGDNLTKIIRINVREPHIRDPHVSLAHGAQEALQKIEKYYYQK